MATDWPTLTAAATASDSLTDDLASAALAVARGYARRIGSRQMHCAERAEFESKFSLRLASHWRQVCTARNPHAYLSRMAQNALRDSRREEARHHRIPDLVACLAVRAY